MKKRLCLIITVTVLVVVSVFAICRGVGKYPDAYQKALTTYLEAMKVGSDKAIKYTAFPNEIIKWDYLHSPLYIIDYEIIASTEVNENLRAYALNVAGSNQPEVYTPIYYFVGCQDGVYTVYINANYVPEQLRENFDISKYDYNSSEYLDGNVDFDN